MSFNEIAPEDFMSFTPGKVATHIQIEKVLNDIGGGGQAGVKFKLVAMKEAGWTYSSLSGYAKNPKMAARAFNKVREALEKTANKDELLSLLRESPD